jgi:predicted cytidylate kinase
MTTVTISGTPGSGKSTVAELLKEKLDLPYVYSGLLFRRQAEKHQMSLADFGRYCEQNDEVDRKLDEEQIKILQKGNVILEGRLAGWLAYLNKIPALKIMLDAAIDVRAQRIKKREQGSLVQQKKEMIQREKSEQFRYKTYYGIDLKDISIYDLVIDTSEKSPEKIVDQIISHLDE